MSGTRTDKSGFAKDAKDAIDKKYDCAQAVAVMDWIRSYVSEVPTTDGNRADVQRILKDGHVLRCLLHQLNEAKSPTGKAPPKQQKMAFKQMEDITVFLQGMTKMGVHDTELFQTVDLYEDQNMPGVINGLSALARKCPGLGLRGFGPKEATANKRDFSEEQLKAGQNVIGLQMGSNKGATQAGQIFGKGRSIMD